MSDKERLGAIKEARKRILNEKSFQKKCILLNSFEELGYLDWLIEQVEYVEELEKDLNEWRNEALRWLKLFEEYQELNKRLREALEFYAGGNHYLVYYDKIILSDDGEKARQALEGENNER